MCQNDTYDTFECLHTEMVGAGAAVVISDGILCQTSKMQDALPLVLQSAHVDGCLWARFEERHPPLFTKRSNDTAIAEATGSNYELRWQPRCGLLTCDAGTTSASRWQPEPH